MVVVIGVVLAGVITLGGVAGYLYWQGGRTTSVAREHLPRGCEAVLRVDVAEMLAAAPVRDHVLRPIEDKRLELEDAGRVSRFVRAKIDPRKHLSELVACVRDVGEGDPSVVAVIGGELASDTVVDALEGSDAFSDPTERDGRRVIRHRDSGLYVAQARSDAAILLASSPRLLADVDEASDAFRDYDLPLDSVVSATITKVAAERVEAMLNALPGLTLRGVGTMEVAATVVPGRIRAEVATGDPAAAEAFVGAVDSFLPLARLAPLGPTSSPTAKKLLSGTSVVAEGGTVAVRVDVPDDVVEDFFRAVGRAVVTFEEG
ncbi:MAG: hypothetical protein AAF928_12070 [Myxococcota bacterium]